MFRSGQELGFLLLDVDDLVSRFNRFGAGADRDFRVPFFVGLVEALARAEERAQRFMSLTRLDHLFEVAKFGPVVHDAVGDHLRGHV